MAEWRHQHEARVVLIGASIYVLVMLAIGAWAASRSRDRTDFVVAGRSLGLWLCTATLLATWMGAGTAMGAAGAAYEGGFLGVIADPFGAALCLLLAGMFYVRILRRMRLLTVVDLFEIKYGAGAGMLAAVSLTIAYIGWTGAQLVAFGYVLQTIAGVSTLTGIVVATIIVLTYTAAGGMWAVALTDLVQIVILILGFVTMLVLVVADLGGWGAVMSSLPEGSFRIVPTESTPSAWLEYVRAWLILGIGSLAAQDLLQRALSSRDERVAQNSAYLAGLGYLTVALIPVLLGMIGAVTMPELADPEFVVPELAMAHLHPAAMTLFIGALLAAIMSSADSALLAPASILASNILPYFKPDASDRLQLAVARYSVPVVGVVALVIAVNVQAVYDLMLDAFSVTLVALFAPVTAAIWWRKANRYGALAAMIGGTVVWRASVAMYPELPGDLLGVATSVTLMLAVTLATQAVDPPRPLLDRDRNPVPMRDRLGVLGFSRSG